MTKERLKTLKTLTTWGGVLITLFGILLNIASGGSWQGNSVSLCGLIVTCCGHWIGNAIAHHQAAEQAENNDRVDDLERTLEQMRKNPPPARFG